MPSDKVIHFGFFVREKRNDSGLSLKEFGSRVGVGEKRMWEIEQMPEPQVNEGTYYGLARACGLTFDQFDKAWRTTPARKPKKRKAGSRPTPIRVVRLPAELFANLTYLAGDRSLVQYLSDHVRAHGVEVREAMPASPPPARSEEGRPARAVRTR